MELEDSAPITARHQGCQRFEHPEVIPHHLTVDSDQRKRLKRDTINERGGLERRPGEIEREVNRLVYSTANWELSASRSA
jgi:hypothetical protein